METTNSFTKKLFLSLILTSLLFAAAFGCTTDDDCGAAGQQGLCQAGVCQCGLGFTGNSAVDPIFCNSTCVPDAVPDSIAFLNEPSIDFGAEAGNLVLGVTLDGYAKQIPTTVAFNNPLDGTACAMLPSQLGSGVWTQETINAAGECDTKMTYRSGFAAEVAQACWNTLAPTTETGAQFSISYNQYQTVVEVVQEGLAPFGQSASSRAARDDTTINRTFRREYTIKVATEFRASSQPFQIVADGRIRYRLVNIEYDLLNNKVIIIVETETQDTAKLQGTVVNPTSVNLPSLNAGGPSVGVCQPTSPAGTCRQLHTIELSGEPCEVTSAEMKLDVEFVCSDGSNATTCGYQNLPAGSIYLLDQLLIDYDSCPRVIEYGIDTGASFLRLFTDNARANALAAPAAQDDVLFGRCSIAPSGSASFQSVTLSSLAVIRVASPTNVNLGDQLTQTFMTLTSPATSSSPSNPIWDFDLLIDGAFFDLTEAYFLEATLDLTFSNTGPLTRTLKIPIAIPQQKAARKLGRKVVHNELVLVQSVRDGEPTAEEGVFSSTFRFRAPTPVDGEEENEPAPEGEGEVQTSDNIGLIVGVAVGVAVVAAVAAVIIVVVVKKRRKRQDEEDGFSEMPQRSSEATSDEVV